MMRVLCAPDSFKGSLSAPQAAQAMADGIRRVLPEAECVLLPLADGGEGTLDALLAADCAGRRVSLTVQGPMGTPISAFYGVLADGKTAVVEMAQASGLGLVPEHERDIRRASTFGVGELLLAAAHEPGIEKLIVGLGGSATNDGGAGAMQALGVRFLDGNGEALPDGVGGTGLAGLARIDISGLLFPVGAVSVKIASDVTNPLTGPQGASVVFGPQKGARPADIEELDAALSHYASILARDLGRDTAAQPGAGAAGGLGVSLMAFLDASLQSGIDLVLDAADFDAKLLEMDWVWTGEGKIDAQTLAGKTIAGVLRRAQAAGVPVIAFGGAVDEDASDALSAQGLTAAFPIMSCPMSLADAMQDGARLLSDAAARVARLLASAAKGRHAEAATGRSVV